MKNFLQPITQLESPAKLYMVRCDISKKARALLLERRLSHVLTSHWRHMFPKHVTPWWMGELARSWWSNTSPILPHPRGMMSSSWHSKYFLSYLCGQHQSQPSCISSRAKVSSLHTFHGCYSDSRVFYQLVVFSRDKLLGRADVGMLAFENFLNPLEDSETTGRVVKDPIVKQQASSALIRFFRVGSFDLWYLCKHRCSHGR